MFGQVYEVCTTKLSKILDSQAPKLSGLYITLVQDTVLRTALQEMFQQKQILLLGILFPHNTTLRPQCFPRNFLMVYPKSIFSIINSCVLQVIDGAILFVFTGASACVQLKTFDEASTWCDKGLAVSLSGAEIIFLYSFLTILKTYLDFNLRFI